MRRFFIIVRTEAIIKVRKIVGTINDAIAFETVSTIKGMISRVGIMTKQIVKHFFKRLFVSLQI